MSTPDNKMGAAVIEKQTYCAIAVALLLCVILILGAGTIAIANHHAHDFNRAGALLVIVSLGLVAYQFLYETSAERRRDAIVGWLEQQQASTLQFSSDPDDFNPERRAQHLIHALIWRSRLTIVVASVGIGTLGEIVHGFGDLALETVACHLLSCLDGAVIE